jgi:hypothetical protein
MVRQAVRQAHGPEQSRRTHHHPEPGRRANNNDQNSKSVLVIEYCNLEFICNLVLGIWNFKASMHLRYFSNLRVNK